MCEMQILYCMHNGMNLEHMEQSDALQQHIRQQVQLAEERATRAEEEARNSKETALGAEQRAAKAEQLHLETKPQNEALQQHIRQQVQQAEERATRAEEEARNSKEKTLRAEQRAAKAEQLLLETKQQNEALQQHIRQQVQQAEERATRAEEEARNSKEKTLRAEQRAAKAEQLLLETKQRNEALQQQIRLQVHLAEERGEQARKANERASMAEQELVLSRQQSEAQLRYPVTQGIPNYLKPSWKIERDEIDLIEGKPLGVGGWGEVRVAMFRGVKVAAKLIHEAIISPHNIDLFLREMNIAASVRHPNLLLFIGATLDDNRPVILTELMPANLRNIIEAPSQVFSRGHVISVSTDLARGLNYLHLMRPDPIIHRDVSSANVLLEPIGSGNWKAKVSDYGSANFLSKVTTMGPGNVTYAAPESLNPKRQSPKMDVYSYGILLLEMATRKFPDNTLIDTLIDTLLWQEIATVIRRCICEDPVNRPTMKDLLILMPQLNR